MLKDTLECQLLGSPQLRWHDQPLEYVPPKLSAVLYYLAVQGRPVPRSELEHLFWGPGSGESLRQALHHLRGLPGAAHWLLTGPEVCINTRSDLKAFETAVIGERHHQALEIWNSVQPSSAGSSLLLRGFKLESTPAFGDWLEFERARVAMLYLEALEWRAFELERAGAVREALLIVQILLREDPLNESAYRAAMRLSHQNGQPEMARYYLEKCRRVLRQEFGGQPFEETVLLARIPEVAHVFPEPLTLRLAFEQMPDPRGRRGQRYSLPTVLGLVLFALLCGENSLRGISRFAHGHPSVLRGLGFRDRTVPGRSALSELLDQINPFRLHEALKGITGLPMLWVQRDALELLRHWSLEVRRCLAVKRHTNRLDGLLKQLGWHGLQDCVVLSEQGDGTLAVRSVPESDFRRTPSRTSARIGTSTNGLPGTPGLIGLNFQSQPEGLGSGANLEL
jgi:DNA-binding SARP family transcriptional activator